MDLPNFFIPLFYCSFLLTSGLGIHGSTHRHHRQKHEIWDHAFRPTKLFVFGDSYADTGNIRKSLGRPWNKPYGATFPGKPAGRFSDGRVLTDYLAKFLGLKSPLAYEWMNLGGRKLRNGLNFAYGGSGVFNTLNDVLPNMTTQISLFEKLIITDQPLYTKWDLQSSLVLVCLSGNDYAAFMARNNTPQGLRDFIPLVINQLTLNLKRIHGLGATKIAVTALPPLGCLPHGPQTSFYQCNATLNNLVNYHNLLLQQSVAKLNDETNSSAFYILDLYTSFTTVLQQKRDYQGNLKFETPLQPCCVGINNVSSCGSVNEKGEKLYRVCSDPKTSFFWDSSHPTDAGWHAVYTTLKSGLEQIYKL